MKIVECEQGTDAWFLARATIPTASDMKVLVTAGGEPKNYKASTGEGIKTYAAEKLAARWLGRALDAFAGTKAMDNGTVLEDDAIPSFTLETGLETEKVGFITTDDGSAGCSPDALVIGTNIGVEAKCPKPETHVKYLIDGVLPAEYFGQVQASMMICEARHWWFISYCRGFPELIVRVERDAVRGA